MLMPSRWTRQQEWLLKNSLTSISQKLLRIRKLYKRFFPVSWTFSITRFLTFSGKPSFSTATPVINTYLIFNLRLASLSGTTV
jgi:hypothetical protein